MILQVAVLGHFCVAGLCVHTHTCASVCDRDGGGRAAQNDSSADWQACLDALQQRIDMYSADGSFPISEQQVPTLFLKKRRQNCCSDNSNADDGSSVEQRARQLRGPAAGSRLDVERADEEVDVEEVVWEGAAVSTDIGHNCSVQLEPP